MDSKYITLLITPEPLHNTLFSYYHVGPSEGHMGECNTMLRLKLIFFWPKMSEEVKIWLKQCVYCVFVHK